MKQKIRSGFTLVELAIGVTIFAMILSATYEFFFTCDNIMKSSANLVYKQTRLQVVANQLRTELSYCLVKDIDPDKLEKREFIEVIKSGQDEDIPVYGAQGKADWYISYEVVDDDKAQKLNEVKDNYDYNGDGDKDDTLNPRQLIKRIYDSTDNKVSETVILRNILPENPSIDYKFFSEGLSADRKIQVTIIQVLPGSGLKKPIIRVDQTIHKPKFDLP